MVGNTFNICSVDDVALYNKNDLLANNICCNTVRDVATNNGYYNILRCTIFDVSIENMQYYPTDKHLVRYEDHQRGKDRYAQVQKLSNFLLKYRVKA